MFWKYNNNSSSEIDALVCKEDVTLFEVMDAEDIINQCKVQSKGLIDFLLKPEMMEELVSLITREPSTELDERIRFKYPNIACELLTSDVSAINERLASDEVLLDKLYSFLECEPPLNPLLASYFSRIMGALIAKKTEQVSANKLQDFSNDFFLYFVGCIINQIVPGLCGTKWDMFRMIYFKLIVTSHDTIIS
jgi:hypothetical protein